MLVLGLDPSLTNYGWALHDTTAPVGDASRCPGRGRFRTPAKMEFIERYLYMRTSLCALIQEHQPDRVGIEFPIFNDLWSEGMYGLFLYSCEALKTQACDVVFWSPMQVKAHARDSIDRPPKWKMDKADMVEAARADAGGGRWNHNEADAYLVGKLASRFWLFYEKSIAEGGLTPLENRYFTEVKKYIRGKKAGREVRRGIIHRENDRFFIWSR